MATTGTQKKPNTPTSPTLVNPADSVATPAPTPDPEPAAASTSTATTASRPRGGQRGARGPKSPSIWPEGINTSPRNQTLIKTVNAGKGVIGTSEIIDSLLADPAYAGVSNLTGPKVAAQVKRLREHWEELAEKYQAKAGEGGEKSEDHAARAQKYRRGAAKLVLGRSRSTPDTEGLLALLLDDEEEES